MTIFHFGKSENSPVKELTRSHFDPMHIDKLKDKHAAIVMFYKPNCPYCKASINDYNDVALRALFMNVFAVNSEANQDLVNDIRNDSVGLIVAYPTIIFYDNGAPVEKFNASRTSNAMIENALRVFKKSNNLIKM